jgi:hypothetical protein
MNKKTFEMKNLLFILLTIVSFIYCFRFGYILTAYGHGGQVIGIPFAFVMLGLSIWHGRTKNQHRKNILFVATLSYFISLLGFSITIELIRINMDGYFKFLYLEPTSWVDIILMSWLGLALVATTTSIINKMCDS